MYIVYFFKKQQVYLNTFKRLQYLTNFIFSPRVSIHRMLQFNQYGNGNFAEKSPLMACYHYIIGELSTMRENK